MILADTVDSLSIEVPFAVTSGALSVTDPCYRNDPWCSGVLPEVRNGTWLAQVGYYRDTHDIASMERHLAQWQASAQAFRHLDVAGSAEYSALINASIERATTAWLNYSGRIAFLAIHHSQAAPIADLAEGTLLPFTVGVDSGQAGFFDRAAFGAVCAPDSGPDFESFYDRVGELTMGKDEFGALEWGATSRSGYGDGGYEAYARRDAEGQVVAAVIVFITADDEAEAESEAGQAPFLQ